MEAWRWSAAGLHGEFDSWPQAKQREAARWLARLSLEKAALTALLPVVDALERGEPLPAPFAGELSSGDGFRQSHAVAAVRSAASDGLNMVFFHAENAFGDDLPELIAQLRARYFADWA